MNDVRRFRFALITPLVILALLLLLIPLAASAIELSESEVAESLRATAIEGSGNVEDSYNLENAAIGPIAEQIAYRKKGSDNSYHFAPVTPSVVVFLGEKELTQDVDYEVAYVNNDQPGIATVNVTGIGDYSGSKSATFNVVGDAAYDISKATISGLNDIELNSYDLRGIENDDWAVSVGDFAVALSGKYLDYDDYIYTEKMDKGTGKITVTVAGEGVYFGEKTVQLNVIAHFENFNMRCYNKVEYDYSSYDEEEDYYYEPTVYYLVKNQKYTGKAIQPKLNVEVYGTDEDSYYEWYDDYGELHQDYEEYSIRLKEGRDYKLVYKNNTSIGKATVSVVGTGIYRGTINETFKITYPISKAKISAISKKNVQGQSDKTKAESQMPWQNAEAGYRLHLKLQEEQAGR